MRLSPARRAIYGIALFMAFIGLFKLFAGFVVVRIPIIPLVLSMPVPAFGWQDGTMWLAGGFLVLNLLILLEVADRLTLKKDLEVAREIQQAMLPREIYAATGIEAFGVTRPANTVGGDLYDVLLRPDGRIVFALGDVAGKGSPAALLMALVVAMLRVLVDEQLLPTELAERLNIQVSRHAPSSRFVTMVVGLYEPDTGRLVYVNAGQNPPILRRASGRIERLTEGGIALGMFDQARYQEGTITLEAGDVLVLFSDGITEAENASGVAFDDAGLELVINQHWWQDLNTLGTSVLRAVEAHAAGTKIADDLTGTRRAAPGSPAVHRRMTSAQRTICLLAIVTFGFIARAATTGAPIFDHHSWRQADTAMIARNFAMARLNPLYPQVDHRGALPVGYVATGFELQAFLAALIAQATGFSPQIGRVLSVLWYWDPCCSSFP